MKAFGIELRKADTVASLYNDVDAVLQKVHLKPNEINATIQVQTTAHALQKMFNQSGHFSVCAIDKCAELCQVTISEERQRVYSAVHCVSWSEMTADYRQTLVAMVLDDFRAVLVADTDKGSNLVEI